jgi:hypothetical protein
MVRSQKPLAASGVGGLAAHDLGQPRSLTHGHVRYPCARSRREIGELRRADAQGREQPGVLLQIDALRWLPVHPVRSGVKPAITQNLKDLTLVDFCRARRPSDSTNNSRQKPVWPDGTSAGGSSGTSGTWVMMEPGSRSTGPLAGLSPVARVSSPRCRRTGGVAWRPARERCRSPIGAVTAAARRVALLEHVSLGRMAEQPNRRHRCPVHVLFAGGFGTGMAHAAPARFGSMITLPRSRTAKHGVPRQRSPLTVLEPPPL